MSATCGHSIRSGVVDMIPQIVQSGSKELQSQMTAISPSLADCRSSASPALGFNCPVRWPPGESAVEALMLPSSFQFE